MTLPVGTRLGPYEILAPLGAGGMGEVYRARDTRLGREVAVKVLPAGVSSDPERLKRFEKEACSASALNHPNIVTIHDIGESGGTSFIAMELLDGRTLREILAEGALQTRRLLAIATQVADGLAKAHGAGIVHRDLKPENIMVTKDGFAKILDFGLAKLTQPEDPTQATCAPTVSGATEPGIVMGTVGYMSPEQAVGEPLDSRSDQFSFGSIVYEMATGRRAFAKTTVPETLSAIIREEPEPIETLSPATPAPLRWVVERCLAKSPEDRYASTRDLSRDLATLRARVSEASGGNAVAPIRPDSWRRVLPWILTVILGVALMARLIRPTARPIGSAAVRFSVVLPESVGLGSAEIYTQSALSPDGGRLVFVGARGGRQRLYVRPLDAVEAKPLDGTEGAISPFWSPDGHSIGFFADGKLQSVSASGGPSRIICETALWCVPTWSANGTILFTGNLGSSAAIYSVPDSGAKPRILIRPDSSGHPALWPQFLPDGRHFLFLTLSGAGERHEIRAGSIDSTQTSPVTNTIDTRVEYTPPGFLLFGQQGSLMAQPFDLVNMRLRGEPVVLAESVYTFSHAGNVGFTASRNVSVAYEQGTRPTTLAWFNRAGSELGRLGPTASVGAFRLSPDGQTVAMQVEDSKLGSSHIWLWELSRNVGVRLSHSPSDDQGPVWSADGKSLFFRSDRKVPPHIYKVPVTSPGAETEFLASPGVPQPEDSSPDGRFLLFTDYSDGDLRMVPVTGKKETIPIGAARFSAEGGRFSPDGRWIAYASKESGAWDVYVTPRDGGGQTRQISVGGGRIPRWRRDGTELYYVGRPGDQVLSVSVRGSTTLDLSAPVPLFHVQGTIWDFDVASDGRFLVDLDKPDPAPISVLLNWPALLGR